MESSESEGESLLSTPSTSKINWQLLGLHPPSPPESETGSIKIANIKKKNKRKERAPVKGGPRQQHPLHQVGHEQEGSSETGEEIVSVGRSKPPKRKQTRKKLQNESEMKIGEASEMSLHRSKIVLKSKPAAFTDETMKRFHTHEEEQAKLIDKFFKYDSVASKVDELLAESALEAKQKEPMKMAKKALKIMEEKPKKIKKKPKPPPEPEESVQSSEIDPSESTEISTSVLVSDDEYIDLPVVTKKHAKSPRLRHYKHFTEISHLFAERYGSSPSTDSFVSDVSGEDKHDMSWILDDDSQEKSSASVKSKATELITRMEAQKFYESVNVLLMTLKYLGRMPFNVHIDKASGDMQCESLHGIHKFGFGITTFLLLLAFLSGTVSAFAILFGDSAKDDYLNFEKLLLQKHWLHMTHFLCTLLMCVVSSMSLMMSGKQMVEYINGWGQALRTFKYDVSNGIRKIAYFNLFLTAADILIWLPLVYVNVVGLRESNRFITTLLFRWVIPGREQYLLRAIDILQHFVLVFQLYILSVNRSLIGMVLIFCRGIVNAAHHWNLCISLILEKTFPHTLKLKNLKAQLTHKELLEDHFAITKLVRTTSSIFGSVFITFFCVETLLIICEMFKVATVVLFDLKPEHEDGLKVGNTDVNYNRTDEEDGFEIVYFVSLTFFLFSVFCLSTSAVGETVMDGFDPVRRFGLLLARSAKERKFIMSLTMSFGSKDPYVLNPKSLFNIDRSVIMSVMGAALVIFSMVVQLNVVNLVQVAIVMPCPGDSGGLCVMSDTVNVKNGETPDPIVTNIPPITIGPTTIGSTTTTTEPPFVPFECTEADKTLAGWVSEAAKWSDKLADCGEYCDPSYARIYRMIPRMNDTEPHDLDWGTETNDRIKNCIAEPYKAIDVMKFPVVYDCFGNCYKTRDSCGHYAFSLFASKLPLQMRKVNNEVATGGFKGECYMESETDKPKQKEFQPLEICGLPYSMVNKVCGRPQDLKNLYDNDLIWNPAFSINPICTQATAPRDPSNEMQLVQKIPYEFADTTKIHILRLKAFTYVSNPSGDPIPIVLPPAEFDKMFFYESYVYINPQLISSTINPNSSYGLYDCFGKPLKEFDDCGGLPFSIVDDNGKRNPKRQDVKIQFKGDILTFSCWESWLPNYLCDIPKVNDFESLIYSKCDLWKQNFLKSKFLNCVSYVS